MIYQILNGDALAYSFPDSKIAGDLIVAREALIDGELAGHDGPAFWQTRASYLGITEAEYRDKVASEFDKIRQAPDGSEFNLWFEYDLFCQVNLWYILSLLHQMPIRKKVYAVYTTYLDRDSKHFWNGYGPANAEQLQVCFADRVLLSEADLQLGSALWTAYKTHDFATLTRLANDTAAAFPHLQEVVQAHIDRYPQDGTPGRPEQVIEAIIQQGATDFPAVFAAFWKRASIYGFGDTQLKQLYDKVIQGQ